MTHVERIPTSSLTAQARDAILQSILDGRFVGGRLPPEDALAVELGVSRTTTRAALQILEQDGLITRRRGFGTVINNHVAPSRLGLHRLVGFSQLLSETGHVPSVDIDVTIGESLSAAAALRLGRPQDCHHYLLSKTFYADQVPAIRIEDIVPADMIAGQLDLKLMPDAIFDLFDSYGHDPIDHAVAEIIPRVSTKTLPAGLQLHEGTAYLQLNETHYNRANDILAISEISVHPDYIHFDVVRRSG